MQKYVREEWKSSHIAKCMYLLIYVCLLVLLINILVIIKDLAPLKKVVQFT